MIEILDCTLRDGSYAIDFGFTTDQTEIISSNLHNFGCSYVEVGHGIGLGASAKGMGVAAASDEEYMAAAMGRWGMFCIPGIAELDDIRLAADHKMDFIRIGCNIEDVANAAPFICLARTLGIYVFSNMLKSYTESPRIFAERAKELYGYGAQCVYIVDSAGYMTSQTIRDYALAVKEINPNIDLAFHGHNNLGLAVANAFYCHESGLFRVVDTTMQGIGRGGGNVSTEQFLALMVKHAGYESRYLVPLMQLSEDYIRPLMGGGISSLDVVSGMAGFHSSYMPKILKWAKVQRIDPRYLILAVAARNQVDAPEKLIADCARGIEKKNVFLPISAYCGEEQG